jgi:hypothetical protein
LFLAPQQYLIPNARKQTGTEESVTTVSDDAIHSLVRNYCRENGVRNLQKHIEKVCRDGGQGVSRSASSAIHFSLWQIHRKLALKVVKSEDPARPLEAGDLYDYVGKPVFSNTRMYEVTPPGVAVGLAWTSMGMHARVTWPRRFVPTHALVYIVQAGRRCTSSARSRTRAWSRARAAWTRPAAWAKRCQVRSHGNF